MIDHWPQDLRTDYFWNFITTPMKARYTSLFIAMGCFGIAQAQTLNNSNSVPLVGNSYTQFSGAYLSPGNAGANQTWDLSSLVQESSTTSEYVTPASTGFGSAFPNTNIASSVPDAELYGFYNAASDGLYFAGTRIGGGFFDLTYTNTDRQLALPCSFNTSWTDQWSAAVNFFGATGTRSGTTTGLADGFGTLITPFGTFTNVLRVKLNQNFNDNLGALGTINYTQEIYLYYKPGVRIPLASLSTTVTTAAGQPSETETSSTWLDASTVGIGENATHAIGMELFPNPANDRVNITFGAPSGDLQVQLIDGNGRVVLHEQLLQQPMGINQVDLPLGSITAGVYLLRITAANGDQGVKRLVIE